MAQPSCDWLQHLRRAVMVENPYECECLELKLMRRRYEVLQNTNSVGKGIQRCFDEYEMTSQEGNLRPSTTCTYLIMRFTMVPHHYFFRMVEFGNQDGDDVRQITESLADGFIRWFDGLAQIDVDRAVYTYISNPDRCEPVVSKLITATRYFEEDTAVSLPPQQQSRLVCLQQAGAALWRLSSDVPRSLEPSGPPPPYTLFAFNIELDPIDWQALAGRGAISHTPKQVTKRKKTTSEDFEQVRKRRETSLRGQVLDILVKNF